MIEFKTAKQDSGYIPYPLRYKDQKEDNKKLLFSTMILSGGYLLFLAIIGMKLGFM